MHRLGEVAKRFDVDQRTVRRWIASDRLKAIRLPGGHFRVESEELERFTAHCERRRRPNGHHVPERNDRGEFVGERPGHLAA